MKLSKRLVFITLFLLFLCGSAWATGTAVFSYTLSPDGKVVTLQWVCTTGAGGSPELTSPTITQAGSTPLFNPTSLFRGFIVGARIIPDGTSPPTALYDVELRDYTYFTIDYLGGLGDNCSQTVVSWGIPIDEINGMAVYIPGRRIIPYAANAGNSKIFTLEIDLAVE